MSGEPGAFHRCRASMTVARVAVLSLAMLGVSLPAVGQDRDPTATLTHLAGSVHLLDFTDRSGGRTNLLASIGADGLLLVDHPGDWRTLETDPDAVAVVKQAWTPLYDGEPTVMINTHWHGDHTAGNVVYPDATIYAQRGTRRNLMRRQTPWWFPDGIGPLDPAGLPDVTFVDSLTIHYAEDTVHLWHFGRAHTDGDAVVYFTRADVVHMGDLYHGLDDPSFGEDMVGLIRTLDEVVARIGAGTRVVTGHAGVTSRDELARYAAMLRETVAHVRAGLDAGMSLAALQQRGLPARWHGTIENPDAVNAWIEEIHRTLTAAGR